MFTYLITYGAIVIFIVAVIARLFKIYSTPLHLRWEIYPVAHEPGDKPSYGGSYLEEQNWWEKPRQTSFINMMKVQLPEMIFLTAVREHNRSLWYRSFPFHFGLYLIAATIFFIFISFIPFLTPLATLLATICGFTGIILGLVGSIGLLMGRLTNEEYDGYSAPIDIFNLILFVVTFSVALLSFLFVDPNFSLIGDYFKNLVTFSIHTPIISPLITVEIFLFSILLAYIPLTHMSHFFVKYFTYHDIRWNDEPNIRGGKYEKAIEQVLNYRVSWSAPHIKGEGKKTWVEVASEDIEK